MIDLITAYLAAKQKEADAKAVRLELGAKLAAALEHPADGQKTHKIEGYKVSVKGVVNRKVDWDAFDHAMRGCATPAPYVTKRELDLKGLGWYAEFDPDRYHELSKAITAKPGTPQITIKEPGK